MGRSRGMPAGMLIHTVEQSRSVSPSQPKLDMAQDVRPRLLTIAAPDRSRPKLYVTDGKGYVWDADSAASLLSEFRIWATPVGVRRARNKSPEHNFPCVLSPQQATLVLRRNLADVYCDHPLSRENGDQEGRDDRLGPAADVRLGDAVQSTCNSQEIRGLPDTAGSGVDWRYPKIPEDVRSMAVFEDLWERGLCVADGSNYGADFVVYDGPPTECHSVAGVLVSRGQGDELAPAEVSGFARVQQAVAKRAVIATSPLLPSSSERGGDSHAKNETKLEREARKRAIRYVTLQFHSVGNRTL